MRLEFSKDALDEYKDAARYYAGKDPLLGQRFIEAVEEALVRVLESPMRWRTIDNGIRRCMTHVFPYGIVYSVEAERILILAVMHCRRQPGYWQEIKRP